MCAAKSGESSTNSPVHHTDDDIELQLSLLPLLRHLGGGAGCREQKKADRIKRSTLKKKYGQDIGKFRETTGNVASIDFGTTFCSLAYTTGAEEENVANVKLNEFYSRVPTAVLLSQKTDCNDHDEYTDAPIPKSVVYEVQAFGYQAQDEHCKLRNDDRSKCLYFEHFKMSLQQDEVGYNTIIIIIIYLCIYTINCDLSMLHDYSFVYLCRKSIEI